MSAVDRIRALMDRQDNIRTMSVIAHVDHGKTTLTDSLLSLAGLLDADRAGDKCVTDTMELEQERGVTIKSTAVALYYEREMGDEKEKEPFLIHLIDSPGHVDFSSEVSAALRVTDGALVVVDCVEGVCVQTETVLRQAITERIKPVLFLNKLDRAFLELHLDREDAYLTFRKAVEKVNEVAAIYGGDDMKFEVSPEDGTVGFGSGLHAWGFTLETFAIFYAKKYNVDKRALMKRLWGEHFWDAKNKKWLRKAVTKDGRKHERGFCYFVLKPIEELIKSIMDKDDVAYKKVLKKNKIDIKDKDTEGLVDRKLVKYVMRNWLPCGDALLDMICDHLPSPRVAQKYRVQNLYSGPQDDEAAQAIATCNPDGPLMMYISKMVPSTEKGRFYSLGRVFSGTVKTGQNVRIMGPDYQPGDRKDLYVKRVQRTVIMMADTVLAVGACPSGNIIGLVGIDQFILKNATLSSIDSAHIFNTMKFSVAPVVRVAVKAVRAADLPKLAEGLRRLAKSDPLILTSTSKLGEHIIAGAGELHLECVLHDLRNQYMKNAPITESDPVVSYCETVSKPTEVPGSYKSANNYCLAKSANGHNRLFMSAEPLSKEFCDALDDGTINVRDDLRSRGRQIGDSFPEEWDVDEARKIWTFGIVGDGFCNVLVDRTRGAQYVNEIKDSLVGGFLKCTDEGVLCDEPLRGIRFNLEDIKLHADAIHRGAGQLMPATRRAMAACQIASGPRLMEPVYLVEITVQQDAQAGVYNVLNRKRGVIHELVDRPGTPLVQIKAFLPVAMSFGFTKDLRAATQGKGFPQLFFSHWDLVSGDVYEDGSPASVVARQIRQRKELKLEIPGLSQFCDKL